MIKITVEEIDILVQANIEGALKEFKKLVPEIKNQVSKIKQQFDNMDLKTKIDAIDMKQVNSSVQKAKKQIKQVFNPDDVSGLTINYKKVINGISEEFDKLKGKKIDLGNAIDLNNYKKKIAEIPKTISKPSISDNGGRYVKYDSNSILNKIEGKSNNVAPSKQSISMWDTLKSKIQQIKPAIQRIKSNINGDMFKGIVKAIPKFDGISNATIKIKNQIKQWSSSLKGGLSQILKYAGALFSLQGIYSLLRGSANSWLSSQNAQAQQLSANIEYMKYALGSVFAGVIQYVTNLVYKLMKAVQSLVYAFSGVNIFAKATASSMKGASKSAKDTNKSLAGVHNEINNVSESKNSGGGSSVSSSMDLSNVSSMSNSILDTIKNGNWYEVGALIAQKLNEAMESIDWTSIQEKAREIAGNIGEFINGFVAELDWSLLGSTIGNGINTAFIFVDTLLTQIDFKRIGSSIATGFGSAISTIDWGLIGKTFADGFNMIIDTVYGFVTTFSWSKFGTAIGTAVNGFFKNIHWKEAGQNIGEGLKGVFSSIKAFLEEVDWVGLATDIVTFLINIDWIGILSGFSDVIFEALGTLLGGLGVIIGGLISEAFTGIEKYFQDKVEEMGGNVVGGILKGIGDALVGIFEWINEHVCEPITQGFKNAFGIHSPSTLMAELGTYLIQGLFNGIMSLVDTIKEIWINMKETAITKFTEIKDGVVEKISNLKMKATEIWDNIKTTITEKINNAKNNISTALNNIKNTWSNIFNSIKTTTSNIFNGIWSTIRGIINKILGGIEGFANGVVRGINTVLKGLDGVVNAVGSVIGVDIHVSPMNEISLPRLKTGGVLYEETQFVGGEYSGARSNPEIVSPVNLIYETQKRAIEDSNMSGQGGDTTYIFKIGNTTIAEICIDEFKRIKRQTGKDLEVICEG